MESYLTMSQNEVAVLSEKLDKVIQQNHSIVETQDRMLVLISGNPLDKDDKGLVGEFNLMKKEQERVKKYSWMIVGGAFVVGALLDVILKYVLKV